MRDQRSTYRRLVQAADAAEVVGCDSIETFLSEVSAGVWPRPLPLAAMTGMKRKRRVWDLRALHAKIDELSGIGRRLPIDDLDAEMGIGGTR